MFSISQSKMLFSTTAQTLQNTILFKIFNLKNNKYIIQSKLKFFMLVRPLHIHDLIKNNTRIVETFSNNNANFMKTTKLQFLTQQTR